MTRTFTEADLREFPDSDYMRQLVENQEPFFYIGLDLGQASDPTAVIVLEKRLAYPDPLFAIRHLGRYQLGTPYPAIVADVASKLDRAPADTRLLIDGTGVGRAVVDMFLTHPLLKSRRYYLHPVTITAGQQESHDQGYHRVPKRNLVGCVQVLLQSGRLRIKEDLPETHILIRELMNFRVKISEHANDSYSAWREDEHDDLVLAAALACWGATSKTINAEWRQGVYRLG